MHTRLGLNVHRDAWPTAAGLSAYEAAGFAWVQVHTPPRAILADRRAALRHARALRGVLDATGLRLLLHAPDDLSAGASEHDREFDGLLDYAAAAGADAHRLPRAELRGGKRPGGRAPPRARPARGAVTHPAPPAGAFPWHRRRDREPGADVRRPAAAVPRPARGARHGAPPRRAGGRHAARPRPPPYHRRPHPRGHRRAPRRVRARRRAVPRARQPWVPPVGRRARRRSAEARPPPP